MSRPSRSARTDASPSAWISAVPQWVRLAAYCSVVMKALSGAVQDHVDGLVEQDPGGVDVVEVVRDPHEFLGVIGVPADGACDVHSLHVPSLVGQPGGGPLVGLVARVRMRVPGTVDLGGQADVLTVGVTDIEDCPDREKRL